MTKGDKTTTGLLMASCLHKGCKLATCEEMSLCYSAWMFELQLADSDHLLGREPINLPAHGLPESAMPR